MGTHHDTQDDHVAVVLDVLHQLALHPGVDVVARVEQVPPLVAAGARVVAGRLRVAVGNGRPPRRRRERPAALGRPTARRHVEVGVRLPCPFRLEDRTVVAGRRRERAAQVQRAHAVPRHRRRAGRQVVRRTGFQGRHPGAAQRDARARVVIDVDAGQHGAGRRHVVCREAEPGNLGTVQSKLRFEESRAGPARPGEVGGPVAAARRDLAHQHAATDAVRLHAVGHVVAPGRS